MNLDPLVSPGRDPNDFGWICLVPVAAVAALALGGFLLRWIFG